MATRGSNSPAVNILTIQFLEDEKDRFLFRYVLETNFEEAKKELERYQISLYRLNHGNDETIYIAKPEPMNDDSAWKSVLYGVLVGFTHGCKTVKKQYPEAYYKTYLSSNEIKVYHAANKDFIWIIGKKEEVNKVCLEIEQKIHQTTTGTSAVQIEPKTYLSCSSGNIAMAQIPLSQEEQALLYLHGMLDSAVFKNDHIIVDKYDKRFAISIQLDDVNASEKMQLESDIKQVIANKRSELFSSEVSFTAEELVFLDREHVFGFVNNRLNLTCCHHNQRTYITCAWYIGKCTVKMYSNSENNLHKSCEIIRKAIITDSLSIPENCLSSPKVKQIIADLLSKYGQKIDVHLDFSTSMLRWLYTQDMQFKTNILENLLVTRNFDFSERKKYELCKPLFTVFQGRIQNWFCVILIEGKSEIYPYRWIIKGLHIDVPAAIATLSTLVQKAHNKEKTYQTDDNVNTIQKYVNILRNNSSCSVTTEDVKSHLIGNALDLRRDVLCHEWKLLNGNFIKIINSEDESWVSKQSAVFKIIVKDKTSSCDCVYQPEGSAIKLYIPEWTSNGKAKHTVYSLLDSFYKGISSEKTKTDISHVLFLSELTKQGWPLVKFLKVFLCALNKNGVSSPVIILESKREIFETVSDILQKFAIHASRPPRIQVTVKTGELAKLKYDAIVNSTQSNLKLNCGSLSKSIFLAAGNEIQSECSTIMQERKQKRVLSTEVVVSKGHNLACKNVFHGALDSWEKQTLPEFVYGCLREADIRALSSIGFPSLGSGNKKYPPEEVANIMFQTVQKYDIERDKEDLNEVDFIIYEKDQRVLQAFRTAEDKRKSGYVKVEKKEKCPNPHTVKVIIIGENEATVNHIFTWFEENLKANTMMKAYKEEEQTNWQNQNVVKASTTISKQSKACSMSVDVGTSQTGESPFQEGYSGKEKEPISMPQLQEGSKTNTTGYQTLAPAPATFKHDIDRKENIKIAAQKKQRSTFNSQQCSSMTDMSKDQNTEKYTKTDENKYTFTSFVNSLLTEPNSNNAAKHSDLDPLHSLRNATPSNENGIRPPAHWSDLGNDNVLKIKIDPNQDVSQQREWENVQKKMKSTLPNARIISIQRLQNIFMWEHYYLKKKQLETAYGKDCSNELTLFHGTTPDSLDMITEQNLDPRLAGSRKGSRLGRGAYFAVSAEYSDQYAKSDSKGHKFMFMVNVLTGKSCIGKAEYQRPPTNPDIKHRLFDSCVDKILSPKIYCIFHDSQYYLEYLIEYT